MANVYRIEDSDLASIKKAIEALDDRRHSLEYPIEIVIGDYQVGTICMYSDHLAWFRNGFELAVGWMKYKGIITE